MPDDLKIPQEYLADEKRIGDTLSSAGVKMPDGKDYTATIRSMLQNDPIAMYGYDPRKIEFTNDLDSDTRGAYSPAKDTIYINNKYAKADILPTIVHESRHRGMNAVEQNSLYFIGMDQNLHDAEDGLARFTDAQKTGAFDESKKEAKALDAARNPAGEEILNRIFDAAQAHSARSKGDAYSYITGAVANGLSLDRVKQARENVDPFMKLFAPEE